MKRFLIFFGILFSMHSLYAADVEETKNAPAAAYSTANSLLPIELWKMVGEYLPGGKIPNRARLINKSAARTIPVSGTASITDCTVAKWRRLSRETKEKYTRILWTASTLQEGDLPETLQSLEFELFILPIGLGVLPAGLESLRFGYFFNQSIDPGFLPAGLKSLTFGRFFNQPIGPGVLPAGLKTLKLHRGSRGKALLPASLDGVVIELYSSGPEE